ncbi:hypothetical protein [Rubrivivax gelatinosus]|uniref:Uncharacterized protein n=1 Tax=Rubrivivax gelatinosus TaxID=28068 RepID=A0ABS1DSJ3_RUBGE|nr:hypothetical protein [Rubrivivax gelatinosus]MBK1712145.1 hypothetical protein [Rubrivivax gelatinosus]
MWFFFVRGPRPDLHVWPGRRIVSAVDALAWPAGIAACICAVPADAGLVGMVGLAGCGFLAIRRLARAVFANERYRLTTVGLWRLLAPLIVFTALLKLGQILVAG